jgi:AcrR family transcriptional regulator
MNRGDNGRMPGRPRNADATDAVLAAALALAHEGGFGHATVERVAEKAGVAKTTIYRRWPHAGAVVMDAFLADIAPLIAYVERGGVVATFKRSVKSLIAALAGPRGRLLRELLGAAQHDEALQQAFQQRWIRPRREAGLRVLQRAVESGELRADADLQIVVDAIFGAVYYRLMIPYAPLTAAYAERLVEQVFAGVSR